MEDTEQAPGSRLGELRASARGWHGVQLAVLGFIGLCGVLQGQADSAAPRWLKVTAGLLVLLALVLSCIATALVASAAWPISAWQARGGSPGGDLAELTEGGRRLRLGVVLTFIAVAVLAVAATSSWWPTPAGGGAQSVLVTTTNGGGVCGELTQGAPGVLAVQTDSQRVLLRIGDVAAIEPVESCR